MSAEPTPRANPDRRIYVAAAIAMTVLILAGFAQSYYLKFFYDAPSLTPLVHLHGFVMTVWFGLFFVQAFLVSKRRVDLHRKLGTFGMMWAPIVFVVAIVTAIAAAKAGHAPPGPPPLAFLAIPLGDMFFFGCVVPMAFIYRRQPAVHKRLMLLSYLGLMAAAIARLPIDGMLEAGPLAYFGLTTLLAIVCAVVDTVRHKRLHPAFGWGIPFLVATQVGRVVLAGSEIWMRFATWVTS